MTASAPAPVPGVVASLLACCGSPRWADEVAAGWPYASLADLTAAGDAAWARLDADGRREALAAHPRIGARTEPGSQEGAEQRGARGADPAVLAALAAGNRRYEERFGMTYVVRATGRSAAEMLRLLETRLAAEPDAELAEACAQQAEITRLRLAALWDRVPA